MKAQDFFTKFNKISWWEILIMLIIAIAVGIHDWTQEPVNYVICKDGTRVNVTPETQSVCNNIPVHYDPLTGKYEIAMIPRNHIINEAIKKQVKESFDCFFTKCENEEN